MFFPGNHVGIADVRTAELIAEAAMNAVEVAALRVTSCGRYHTCTKKGTQRLAVSNLLPTGDFCPIGNNSQATARW